MSGTDPKVNDMWNQLNGVFGKFVAEQFKNAGKRVIEMPHPVEATDMSINTDRLLKTAQKERCDLIASVSFYADQESHKFVTRLVVNPIVVKTSAVPAGSSYTVGDESFSKQQNDPLSKETMDRLVPSEIAKTLVTAYLGAASK